MLYRCPKLQVLYIENATLSNPLYGTTSDCGYVYNGMVPERLQICKYYEVVTYVSTSPYPKYSALYFILRNLEVLSLRNCVFAREDFFPDVTCLILPSKIKVLDFTMCRSIKDQIVPSICQMRHLKELYFSGTAITVNGVLTAVKNIPNLKVLDLDQTVVAGETFLALKQHAKCLSDIYMGETYLCDADVRDVGENTFLNLRKLCLASTHVTEIGVQNLLDSVPSLTCVIVTHSKVSRDWITDLPDHVREKLKYDDTKEMACCNHFLENKGFFKNA